MNPLLQFNAFPLFDQIRPEHVAPAMDDLLAAADAALNAVTQPDFVPQWEAIARVLDVATERLGRGWGTISHLNAVADTPELRAAYNAALPRITSAAAQSEVSTEVAGGKAPRNWRHGNPQGIPRAVRR